LQCARPHSVPSSLRESRRLRLPEVPCNRRPELSLQITRQQTARSANLRGAELRWTLSRQRLVASAGGPLHRSLPPLVLRLLLLLLALALALLMVRPSRRES